MLALLAGAATFATAQNASVKGRLTGMPNAKIYLNEVKNNKLEARDTITPNSKGEYSLELKVEKDALYILRFNIERSNDIHLLVLPKEKITLDLEMMKAQPFVRIANAKGSKNVEAYAQFNHALSANLDALSAIDNEYVMPATTEQRKMELSNQYQNLMLQQNLAIRKIIEQNSSCLISAFLVTYFEQDFATYADLYEKVYEGLKKDHADNGFVAHLQQKLAASLKEGSLAPEIEMKDPQGNTRKLSDLRGNIVMVDFWASWCNPCRRENPNVVKLYHKYHSAGFEIYSVSLDKDKASWLRAIESDGLVWPNHVSDLRGWTSSGGATYGITSVPSTVLIDKQGRIIAKNLRGPDLERKLKELFGF